MCGYHSAAITYTSLSIVDHAELSRSYSLDIACTLNQVLVIGSSGQCSGYELRGVAVFEQYRLVVALSVPRVACDPVHHFQIYHASVLAGCIIAARYIYHIVMDVLFHHIPWTSAQSESFTLAYGVEPEAVVLAEFSSCLNFYNRAFLFAKVALQEVVVVYFSKKAYPLAVASESIGQLGFSAMFMIIT